jgi:asparagine synthase (glutamine-hydrolysing)
MRTTSVIYGLMSKTRNGLERLKRGLGEILPDTFPRQVKYWWCNPQEGFAMYRPKLFESRDSGRTSALSVAGNFYSQQGANPPGIEMALCNLLNRGISKLQDVAGEFSLAFWNSETEELVLARDPLGQRTLFVREDTDFFLYCSDLEPLLSDPMFHCQLDFESAFQYLAFGQPVAGKTLAQGISRVQAAHVTLWKRDRPLFSHRYYSPLSHDSRKVLDDASRRGIACTLDAAIETRIATGKQALLLSGGVDSSYLAASIVAQIKPQRLEAYTISFDDLPEANETEYAALVSKRLGIRHHVVPLNVGQATAHLRELLKASEPFSAWATITHRHLLTQIRRGGFTHLFSGLGADEVFGGYSTYLKYYKLARFHRSSWQVPSLVDATDGLLWNPTTSRCRVFPGIARFFDDASLRKALHPPFNSWNFITRDIEFHRECRRLKSDAHTFELMVAQECQHRIPDLLLTNFEMIARATGMRTVYPFLDPEVVRLAAGLGASERFCLENNKWRNKMALRRIAATRVPDVVLQRTPVSYNAPFLSWMEAPLFAKEVLERLRGSGLWHTGFIKHVWLDHVLGEVARCFQKTNKARLQYVYQLWALLTLTSWYDCWIHEARPKK